MVKKLVNLPPSDVDTTKPSATIELMFQNGFVKVQAASTSRAAKRCVGAGVAVAFVLVLTACGGSRPELVETDTTLEVLDGSVTTAQALGESTTSLAGSVTSQPEVTTASEPVTITDCLTVVGPGPWPIEIVEPAVARPPCGRTAAHHRVEFINKTANPISFQLAGQAISIEPGSSTTTEPVGTLAQPGLVPIEADPLEIMAPWLVAPDEDPMQDFQVLLGKFGPVEIGMTRADAEGVLGGNGLKKLDGESCYLSYLLGDPYSPLLTIRDDVVTAVQIYSPGQQTRSGIGVGSTEADIQAAYGDNISTEAASSSNPNQKLMVFVPTDDADKANRIVFAVDNGVVTSLRTGLTESIIAAPGC